jgi:hypothetical protein
MARRLGEAFVSIEADVSKLAVQIRDGLKKALIGVKPSVELTLDAAKLNAAIAAEKAKLVALAGKASRLQLDVDDARAVFKIADLEKQSAHLEKRLGKMKSDVDIAAAIAKLDLIDKELKVLRSDAEKVRLGADASALNAAIDASKLKIEALQKQAQDISLGGGTGGSAGLFGWLLGRVAGRAAGGGGGGGGGGGAGGVLGGLGQIPGRVPIIGGAGVGPVALGGTAAVAGIASTGAFGLIPALAAAGIALGSFAALAFPTLSSLQTALGAVSTASDAYALASANLNTAIKQSPADLKAYHAVLTGLEPDLASAAVLLTNQNITWQTLTPNQQKSLTALRDNAAAYRTLLPDQQKALNALLKQRDAWNALTPAQQSAAVQSQKLSSTFDTMVAALEPLTLQVLTTGLKAVNILLPQILPFALVAGKAIDTLLGGFGKFAASPGFKTFRDEMLKLAGPAILAIGEGFGKITIALGKLLLAMINPNGIRALRGILGGIADVILGIAAAFTWVTPHLLTFFHTFANNFDQLRHRTAADVHQISDYIDTIRTAAEKTSHATEVAFNNLKDWIWNDFVLKIYDFFVNTIPHAFDVSRHAIATVFVHSFKLAFDTMALAVLKFGIIVVRGAKTITDVFLAMVGDIIHGAATAFGWIPGLGGKLRGAAKNFDDWRSGVDSSFDSVIKKIQTWQSQLATSSSSGGHSLDNFRNNALGPLQGSLAKTSGGIQGLQGFINNLHGKTFDITVDANGYVNVNGYKISAGAYFSPHAAGGPVGGSGGPTQDNQLIRASTGEYVVRASSSSKYGTAAMDAVNRGTAVIGYAAGGLVGTHGNLTTAFPQGATNAIEGIAVNATKDSAARATAAFNVYVKQQKAIINAQRAAAALANPGVGPASASGVIPVAQYVLAHGGNRYAAAGIGGVVAGESGGNPEAIQGGGGGGMGLIQWTPGSSARPYQPIITGNVGRDMAVQLADMMFYIAGRGGLASLNNAGSARNAAWRFSAMEAPAIPGSDIRFNIVDALYASGLAKGGLITEALFQSQLRSKQARELSDYYAFAAAFSRSLPGAPKGSWLAGHRAGITGELGTLRKRQSIEEAAYDAVRRSGGAVTNVGHFATTLRELSAVLHDRDLSYAGKGGQPSRLKRLAGMISALEHLAASAPLVKPGTGKGGKGGGGTGTGPGGQPCNCPPPIPLGPAHTFPGGVLTFDRGGFLPPGLSVAWNGTGRNEPVGAGGAAVELHLHVHGPVGSASELETWFVATANHLARTGRLTQAVKMAAGH